MYNKFTLNSTVYDDEYIFGGVSYTQNINANTNIIVGNAYSAKIEFTTDNATLATVGNDLLYEAKQMGDNSFTKVGRFIVSEVTKDRDKYKVTAYDYISKFDKVIDSTIASIWPTSSTTRTAEYVFESICSACGCSYEAITSSWYTRAIPKCISGSNISARSVLGWLASYVGGYAVAIVDNSGVAKIKIKRFASNAASIVDYKSFDKDTQIPQIDSVWAGLSDSDLGTKVGSSYNNTLRITGNPLFSIMSDGDDITGQLTIVLNAVKNISYIPTEIELFKDYGINAGDIITAKGITTLVMEKSWSNSGVKLKSTGTINREVAAVPQELVSLNGKYNTLTDTVTEHTREIGAVGPGENLRSLVSQNASDITLRVQKNDVINQINVSSEGVTINADRINLSGVTTFVKPGDNISTLTNNAGYQNASQVTTICGDTITTGYIEAKNISASSLTVNGKTIGGSSTQLSTLGAKNIYLTRTSSDPSTAGKITLQQPGSSSGTSTSVAELTTEGVKITYGSSLTSEKSWMSILAGGGGEPAAYIKNASVSNGVLTLTKKDDTTVTYKAVFS